MSTTTLIQFNSLHVTQTWFNLTLLFFSYVISNQVKKRRQHHSKEAEEGGTTQEKEQEKAAPPKRARERQQYQEEVAKQHHPESGETSSVCTPCTCVWFVSMVFDNGAVNCLSSFVTFETAW